MTDENKRRFVAEIEIEMEPDPGVPPASLCDAELAMMAALIASGMVHDEDEPPYTVSMTLGNVRAADS